MKKKIVFQNLQKLFTLSFFQAVDGSVSNSKHFMHATNLKIKIKSPTVTRGESPKAIPIIRTRTMKK